jgi:hypothetical protein
MRAVEIAWPKSADMNARRRATGKLGLPGEAQPWLRARLQGDMAAQTAAMGAEVSSA